MASWIPWNVALSLLPVAATDFVRDEAERQRLREELLQAAQDYFKLLLLWAGRAAQVIAGVSFLFATATVLYGVLYFLLIPSRFHEQQIFFDYGERHAALGTATLPSATLNLLDPVHQWHSACTDDAQTQETVLVPGVKYDVIVELTLPESRVNAEVGVFMVATTLRSQSAVISNKHKLNDEHPSVIARSQRLKGEYLASSTRPVTLHDLPTPVRWLRLAAMLAPYTLGFSEPAQTLDVTTINGYLESGERPVTQVEVELNTPSLQVYSAKLTIIAQLTGVRYLMYHWAVPTAILVILNLVFMEALALAILYALYALPQPEDVANDAAQWEAAAVARAKAKQLFEEKPSSSAVEMSSSSGEGKPEAVEGDAKTENVIDATPFTTIKQDPAAPAPSAPPASEGGAELIHVKHEAISDDEAVEVKQEVVNMAPSGPAVENL